MAMMDSCFVRLNKSQIDIGVIHDPPYVDRCMFNSSIFPVNQSNTKGSCRPGLAIEMMQLVCTILSIQCRFRLENFDDWGRKKDSSWTGLLDQLQTRDLDLSLPVYICNDQRREAFRCGAPCMSYTYTFVSRQSSVSDIQLSKIFIFRSEVWGLILLTTSVISIISMASGAIGKLQTIDKMRVPIIYRICSVFGLISSQSVPETMVVTMGSRVAVGSWALAVLILMGHFSGNLLAMLISQDHSAPFNDWFSLARCIETGQCRMVDHSLARSIWGTIFGGNSNALTPGHFAFRQALGGELTNIKMVPREDVIQLILGDMTQFNVWLTTNIEIYGTSGNQFCELVAIPVEVVQGGSLFPRTADNDCLIRGVELAQMLGTEHGQFRQIFQKYVHQPGTQSACSKAEMAQVSLPLNPFLGLVFLLAVGATAGLIVFGVEHLLSSSRIPRNYITCAGIRK